MLNKEFDYANNVPGVMQALQQVHSEMAKVELDTPIQHLVELRASQINGCAYCVKLHTANARRDGESSERLDRLIVWRHVDDFSAAEKAALAWAEALTVIGSKEDLEVLREELSKHYSAQQIGVLTALVGMINLWNRVQVSLY